MTTPTIARRTGKRSYDQYCVLARSLDVLGDRWTLLLVRELMAGPKRYTDLLNGLPGIGPNVLADRLKEMQAHDLISKTKLDPPAASTVYELTELGDGLKPAIIELGRWGAGAVMGERQPGDSFQLAWMLNAMRAFFRPEQARGVKEIYEFRLTEEPSGTKHVFHARVDDGTVELREGPAEAPAVVIGCDVETFIAIGGRQIDPVEAVASGKQTIEGDPLAGLRCLEIFGVPEPAAVAPTAVPA